MSIIFYSRHRLKSILSFHSFKLYKSNRLYEFYSNSANFLKKKLKASDLLLSVKKNRTAIGELDLCKPVARKPRTESEETAPTKECTGILEVYQKAMEDYPNHLIAMQVGDFYEFYFDSAVEVSKTLGIKLGFYRSDKNVPFTGFPIRGMEERQYELIQAGHRIVRIDQFEIEQSLFVRRVARILTPGTLTEDNLLSQKRNNFILALTKDEASECYGIAWADLSTGFYDTVCSFNEKELERQLLVIDPREILLSEKLSNQENIKRMLSRNSAAQSLIHPSCFNTGIAKKEIQNPNNFSRSAVADWNSFSELELQASSALFWYLMRSQVKENVSSLGVLSKKGKHLESLKIDPWTFNSLDIVKNSKTSSLKNSLLHTIDLTQTAFGGRELVRRISNPSLDLNEIERRHNFIQLFHDNGQLLEKIRMRLKSIVDIERAFQRIVLESGSPRDVLSVGVSLDKFQKIKEDFETILTNSNVSLQSYVEMISNFLNEISDFRELSSEILCAIEDEQTPSSAAEGGVIKSGYDKQLDFARKENITANFTIEEEYKKLTGNSKLSVVYRRPHGLVVEVPKRFKVEFLKCGDLFFGISGDTTTVARFKTSELIKLEQKNMISQSEILQLEIQIYKNIRNKIISRSSDISKAIAAISDLDNACSGAYLALNQNYTRPTVNDSTDLIIVDGRHPVVENALGNAMRNFTCNSLDFNEKSRFCLITGPNMGGKSTYLRQNALILLLAQSGLWVPATAATIGIADAIFARIGASDDLAQDKSTFLIEMAESANILNNATPKSLVLMDEVGRGTSPEDGNALSWAICHHLYNVNKCRTLFATHFHHISSLVSIFEAGQCKKTSALIDETTGEATFLHTITNGIATNSHGIAVAKLAGIPQIAIDKAKEIAGSTQFIFKHNP